jgi:hypothetical protein
MHRMNRFFDSFLHWGTAVFASLVLYHSVIVTWLLWRTDLPMLRLSQSWFYIPLPLIYFFFISFTFEFIWDVFQGEYRIAGTTMSPDGELVFMSCELENTVYVVSIETLSVVNTIKTENGCDSMVCLFARELQ